MDEEAPRLFDQVVAASGLSPVFAKSALSRAIQRASMDPNALSRRQLTQLLPVVEQALGVFLKPDQLKARMRDIARLAGA